MLIFPNVLELKYTRYNGNVHFKTWQTTFFFLVICIGYFFYKLIRLKQNLLAEQYTFAT